MSNTWLLRLPQVDRPQQPILVHVNRKKAANLDLDLLATDGEVAYRGKVRQRDLTKLQSRNFEGTEDEWTALLRYALVSKQDSGISSSQIDNLEVDCVVTGHESKARLSITLRSRIEDITHKLGAIELPYSENTDDVDLFGWACQLADQRDKLKNHATSSSKEIESAKNTVSGLEKQLNDLVKAKEEHEEQLLSKFASLLNEKKVFVRNQQRVLQTSKLNKKALEGMQLSIESEKHSISSKRKRDINTAKEVDAEDDDESDGFEAMDVDEKPPADAQGDAGSGQDTPPRSQTPETETASEDDEDIAPPKRSITASTQIKKSNKVSPPPPPRSLPFQKKGQKSDVPQKPEPQPASTMDEDAETESEDDEL